jgi:hypothetical protein
MQWLWERDSQAKKLMIGIANLKESQKPENFGRLKPRK